MTENTNDTKHLLAKQSLSMTEIHTPVECGFHAALLKYNTVLHQQISSHTKLIFCYMYIATLTYDNTKIKTGLTCKYIQ